MRDDVVVSFGNVGGQRAREVTSALGSLLILARDELLGCELGYRRAARGLLALMRFGGAPGRAAVARLAFWAARAGGAAVVLSEVPEQARADVVEALQASDVRISIAPGAIAEGLAAFATAAGVEAPSEAAARPPTLRLCVGGTGWSDVTYDPTIHHLFIPSPLAPPVGDEFDAHVGSAGRDGGTASGRLRTVAVREPHEAVAGAPAGFTVHVADGSGLRPLLVRNCRRFSALGGRTAPRYPVAGPVRVTGGPETASAREQRLGDLSSQGAFIRTTATCSEGTSVRVEIPLPHGRSVELPATVVHRREEGIGVEFGDDRAGRARLDAAITEMTAAARRVLVIDDDELARRMLTDVLQERGFEVVAEPDALAGLGRLAEEILTLELLVTDVMMPALGGEELIRRIRQVGGERDLLILAVTASLDGELTRRLRLAGADAAVSKSVGPEEIANAAELLLRSPRPAVGAREGAREERPAGAPERGRS